MKNVNELRDSNGAYGLELQRRDQEPIQVLTRPDVLAEHGVSHENDIYPAYHAIPRSNPVFLNSAEYSLGYAAEAELAKLLGAPLSDKAKHELHCRISSVIGNHYPRVVSPELLSLIRAYGVPVRVFVARAAAANGDAAVRAFLEFPVAAIATYCARVWKPEDLSPDETVEQRREAAAMIRGGADWQAVAAHYGIAPEYRAVPARDALIFALNASVFGDCHCHMPTAAQLRSAWVRAVVGMASLGHDAARLMAAEFHVLGEDARKAKRRADALIAYLGNGRVDSEIAPITLDSQRVAVPETEGLSTDADLADLVNEAREWHEQQAVLLDIPSPPSLPLWAHVIPPTAGPRATATAKSATRSGKSGK